MKRILETKKIKFICKSEIKDEKAVNDKIELSKISLFIVTNENINSEEFINYYEFCKEKKIFVICITLNPIILSSNLINVI